MVNDGPLISVMVHESGALDLNSDYAYLLMCTHFAMTSAIALDGNESAAFATGYIPPEEPSSLFIWQIGVRPAYRKLGLGLRLINSLLQRNSCKDVQFVKGTINPSNHASQRLFQSLARQHNTKCQTSVFFSKDLFGSGCHEEELLYKVGPLR